jgi:hypothetical protein
MRNSSRAAPGNPPRPASAALPTHRRHLVILGALIAGVAVTVVLAVSTWRADAALHDVGTRTLQDYARYAGRVLGEEILAEYDNQRARAFSGVTARAAIDGTGPTFSEFRTVADSALRADTLQADSLRGFFRYDIAGSRMDADGVAAEPAFAAALRDTLRAIVPGANAFDNPDVMVLMRHGAPVSVAYAFVRNPARHVVTVYGYTYDRTLAMRRYASELVNGRPLLPPSLTGARLNVDSVSLANPRVSNDSSVSVRIADRHGRVLFETPRPFQTPYVGSFTFQTDPGGFVVRIGLRESTVRSITLDEFRASPHTWFIWMILLSLVLAGLAWVVVRQERDVVRAHRMDALRELALGLRHEMNNALAAALLEAELLDDHAELTPADRNHVRVIIAQAERMRDVLRRLERVEQLDVVPYIGARRMVDVSTPVAAAEPASNGRAGDVTVRASAGE